MHLYTIQKIFISFSGLLSLFYITIEVVIRTSLLSVLIICIRNISIPLLLLVVYSLTTSPYPHPYLLHLGLLSGNFDLISI